MKLQSDRTSHASTLIFSRLTMRVSVWFAGGMRGGNKTEEMGEHRVVTMS